MKRSRFALIALSALMVLAMTASPILAATVAFEPRPSDGSKSGGTGEVAPRGFAVGFGDATSDLTWLSSPYDNTGFAAVHTGVVTGVSRLPVVHELGLPMTFFAYVDKNPKSPAIAIYENGVLVAADRYAFGTPDRDVPDPSGQTNRWRVPITGLVLSPGSRYEFAFLRGITANNGMTAVISADGTGYIQSPEPGAEQDHFAAHRSDEYEYREYAQIYDIANASYTTFVDNPAYDPENETFRPMRFGFTTSADLTALMTALADAKTLREGVTTEKIAAGVYRQADVDALDAMIAEIEALVTPENLRQTEIDALVAELEAAMSALVTQPGEPADSTTGTIQPSVPPKPSVDPAAPKTETVAVPVSSNPKTGDASPITALILASVGFSALPASLTLRPRKRV